MTKKKVARRLRPGDRVVITKKNTWNNDVNVGDVGFTDEYDKGDSTWLIRDENGKSMGWWLRRDLDLDISEADLDAEFMALMGIQPVKKKLHDCPDCTHEEP